MINKNGDKVHVYWKVYNKYCNSLIDKKYSTDIDINIKVIFLNCLNILAGNKTRIRSI